MTLAVSIAQSGANNVTMRNKIINGAMMIDQRNAGATVSGGNGGYSVDRWNNAFAQSSKFTYGQSTTAPAGFTNSLLHTVSSAYTSGASDYFLIQHYIEGLNVADFAFGTASAVAVTVSFWVRSSVTGTYSVAITNSADNRAYVTTFTVNSANTFEYKTVTIPGDQSGTWLTTNGKGISLKFDLGSGSNYVAASTNTWVATNTFKASGSVSLVANAGATFYITGVQLEAGTTATAFEQRLYGTELALCQRYYYKEPSASYHPAILDGNSSDYVDAWVFHPVEMRATPSTVFETTGAFYYNSGSAGASFTPSGGTTSFSGTARSGYSIKNLISNPAGSSQIQKVGQWSVQLSFSAEL